MTDEFDGNTGNTDDTTNDRVDDKFDALMRDAAETYRRPPGAPLEAMWTAIGAQLDGRAADGGAKPHGHGSPAYRRWLSRGLPIAATLVVGVAIGRGTVAFGRHAAATPPVVGSVPAPVAQTAARTSDTSLDRPYQVETSRYLGQTAALLISLPSEVKAGHADEQFMNRAGDLLSTTRLLLDSPAANDPSMHDLLEDLELVLTQVVRMPSSPHSRTELDLINQALEQRDVIPRLRTAVADISAN
jgi:hypothetical protein